MVEPHRYRELRKHLIDRGISISDWVEEKIDEELGTKPEGAA